MKKLLTIILSISVFLVACSDDDANENAEPKKMDTKELKTMVHDYSIGKLEAESASITSKELIVTDGDNNAVTYDLPEEEFFVSIAPFIKETHPCTNHSLTGCQGELVNKEFGIMIEDTDGNVVLDKTIKSMENGFIDLWLPRDKTFHVKITHDGKQAESEISTFENDGTCITTMQLM